jgi:hypothetical protein
MELRPFVSLAGFAMASTRVDLGGMANPIRAHSSFGSTDNARLSIRNIHLTNGCLNYNLFTHGGQDTGKTSVLDLYDLEIAGTTNVVCRLCDSGLGQYSEDQVRFTCVVQHGKATIDGGQIVINNTFFPDDLGGDELKLQSTNCRLDCNIIASLLQNVHLYGVDPGTNPSYDINVTVSSSFLRDVCDIQIDHHANYLGTITLNIDRGSVPFPATVRVVYDRADAQIVVNVYDEQESQDNLIYAAIVGDDVRSGLNLNNSVKTLPVALAACTSGGAAVAQPYTVLYQDASVLASPANNCVLAKYCSLQAPNASMEGTMTIRAGSRVQFKEIRAAITLSGGAASEPANDVECRSLTAAITMAASQPTFRLSFGSANSGGSGIALFSVSQNSSAYLCGDAVTGLITADGAGAFVDVSGVRDLRNATFLAQNSGVIRYPPNFGVAAQAVGLLKGAAYGVVSVATPGVDYLVGSQAIALSGDVTGSGDITSPSIAVTINGNAVEASMIETAPAWSLLGNQTGAAATPGWYTNGATLTASGAVMRDASGNVLANHFVEGFKLVPINTNTQSVAATDAGFLRLSGSGGGNLKFPSTVGLATGFSYEVYNGNSGSVIVMNSANTPISTLATGDFARYTTDTAGAWSAYPYYQTVTLSGAVSGSGNQTIVTSIGAYSVDLGDIAQVSGPVALGRLTSGLGDVVAVTSASTAATFATFAHRDGSGNSVFNHAVGGYKLLTFTVDNQTVTASDGEFLRLTGTTGNLDLPAKSTLNAGFAFDVFCTATSVDVRNSASTSQLVMASGDFARFVNGTPASLSWDVYPYYQTITLTGPVTGTGNKSIATAIAAGQIPLSGIATISGPAVLGRLTTGAGAVVSVTSASTAATFDTVVHRNGSGNSLFNHAMEPYVLLTNGAADLSQSSPAYFQFSAAGNISMSLPATTGMTAGFKFSIYNSGAGILELKANAGAGVSTVLANSYADVIWDTAGTPGWRTFPLRTTTSTIAISTLETAPQWSLLARQTGSAGAATWYTLGSANTANGVIARDSSGNFACAHATQLFSEQTSPAVTLGETSAAYFQFSGAATAYSMPSTSGMAAGFRFSIFNAGAAALELKGYGAVTAFGTVPATCYADAIFDGAGWKCYRLASYDNVPAPAPSFTTSLTFNITTGSQALILNGACTTFNAGTNPLVQWAATNMGTSGTMLVEYSAECVASGTATSGAFLGSFRAKYTHSVPSVTVLSPFISEIKDLDAGVNTSKITATSTGGTLQLIANGHNPSTLYWTGQIRITYRVW